MWARVARVPARGELATGQGRAAAAAAGRGDAAMATEGLRIGIAGCGLAARVHLDRLLAVSSVRIVGCADQDRAAAEALAARVPGSAGSGEAAPLACADYRELLSRARPDALAIFTPHLAHYRVAMDALQAGCHVFIERPLSTNVQEASDIVKLARGRNRKVGVGHQYRLRPSLAEARRRLAAGAIGPLRLVTATLAQPWLAAHGGAENSWRFDPRVLGGGILADAGDHLLDALLWTTSSVAVEAAAIQSRGESGVDLVTAAALRLADGTPATLAVAGVTPGNRFELSYYGETGRLHVSDQGLVEERGDAPPQAVPLPEPAETVDANFVAAIIQGAPLCCPAEEALDTVRLLEAVTRSAATGQVVRLA
jgi:predicted dehydrogenase